MGFFTRQLTPAQLKEKKELEEEISNSRVLNHLNARILLLEEKVKNLNTIIDRAHSILVMKSNKDWEDRAGGVY